MHIEVFYNVIRDSGNELMNRSIGKAANKLGKNEGEKGVLEKHNHGTLWFVRNDI